MIDTSSALEQLQEAKAKKQLLAASKRPSFAKKPLEKAVHAEGQEMHENPVLK